MSTDGALQSQDPFNLPAFAFFYRGPKFHEILMFVSKKTSNNTVKSVMSQSSIVLFLRVIAETARSTIMNINEVQLSFVA